MKYNLTSAIRYSKDGKGVEVQMGPAMAVECLGDWLSPEFKYTGLALVENNQSEKTYCHLLAQTLCVDGSKTYYFFVDIGSSILPIALSDGEDITFSPKYERVVAEELPRHRQEVGLPKNSRYNPIMVMGEEDIKQLLEEAEEQKAFEIQKYSDTILTSGETVKKLAKLSAKLADKRQN